MHAPAERVGISAVGIDKGDRDREQRDRDRQTETRRRRQAGGDRQKKTDIDRERQISLIRQRQMQLLRLGRATGKARPWWADDAVAMLYLSIGDASRSSDARQRRAAQVRHQPPTPILSPPHPFFCLSAPSP